MKSYFKLIIAMLIFGSIGIFVKEIPLASNEIVFARTIIGGIFLIFVAIMQRKGINKSALKKSLPLLAISGLALGLNWLFLFESYKYTTVSIATLSYYCAPIIVMLISPIILKEKLTITKIIGIVFAMIGMILISGTSFGGENPFKGLIYGLLAAVFYSSLMILNKLIKGLSSLELTIIQLFFAGIVMFIYVLFTHKGDIIIPSGKPLIILLLICIVHTGIACYLYFSSMQELPGQTVAMFSYIDPVSALILSGIFLGERLSSIQWLGAIFILGGAAFGELYRKKSRL